MSKFNTATAAPVVRGAVTSEARPSGLTYEGAPGWARDAKSELYLLAVTNMGQEKTFYESAADRDSRFAALVRQVAVEDLPWLAGMLPWLRETANMRTAPLIAAAEAVKALTAAGKPGSRQLVASVISRADEPGEMLAYWQSRYGRAIPKPLKRGIADALLRVYSEYALLKYDTASHGYRFADVIELVHPTGEHPEVKGTWRGDLFQYAIERRHNRPDAVPGSLEMVTASLKLRAAAAEDPSVLLDAGRLKAAGMTWEDALSLAGSKLPKDRLWTALAPSMGYMALLRNLRNMDEAGVPDDVAQAVAARLADPEQVARSRQFPFRFLAAFRAAPSLRWAYPLERALNLSLSNVPALKGRSLILVDRSGSMFDRISEKSGLNRADTAAIFGAALAVRSEHADLVEFGTGSQPVEFHGADSVLRVVERFGQMGGTNTADAVRRHFRHGFHSRLVIITDEQAWGGYHGGDPTGQVPATVPVYTWNLAGYQHGHGLSGTANRHTFGGLSDVSFRLVPLLEAGHDTGWPWMETGAP
jgi:hypothetical protein